MTYLVTQILLCALAAYLIGLMIGIVVLKIFSRRREH